MRTPPTERKPDPLESLFAGFQSERAAICRGFNLDGEDYLRIKTWLQTTDNTAAFDRGRKLAVAFFAMSNRTRPDETSPDDIAAHL